MIDGNKIRDIALIIFLSILVYANTFNNEFVWDDEVQIVSNEYIKDLRNIPLFFTKDLWMLSAEPHQSGYYRPLMLLSFALDFRMWKLNPLGYHLTNLFFHVLNSLLVFLLAIRITKKKYIALAASLFFAVHPVHTESVTFIASRNDVMSAFFFLLAFLLYIGSNKRIHYYASSLSFLLALLSKETALVFPLILITYDYIIEGRTIGEIKEKTKFYSPYFAILAVFLILRFFVLGIVPIIRPYYGGSLYTSLLTMSYVLVYYIKILILPLDLNVNHNIPVASALFELRTITSIILLFLVFAIILWASRRERIALFALAWFFITLLPVSNVIPLSTLMAERYLYLPSMGFCLLLAIAFWRAYNHLEEDRKIIPAILFIFIIIFYSAVTIDRNADWRDDLTLWSSTIKMNPNSYDAHLNLGKTYFEKSLYDPAIAEYREALRLDPANKNNHKIHFNLGQVYRSKGLYDLAAAEYILALTLKPSQSSAHSSLGDIYSIKKNLYDQAVAEYEQSLRLDPENVEIRARLANAHNELGVIHAENAYYDLAMAEFNKAIEIDPQNEVHRNALARLEEFTNSNN